MSRTYHKGLTIDTEQRRSRWRHRIVDEEGRTLHESAWVYASETTAKRQARVWIDTREAAPAGRAK